ncbi:MAG TPA: hypothetical protein VJN43_09865 [Bryobacteraceae bacterium]|nr:hypothetical protein [Bryobacteraceae bacterium]
MPETLKPNFLPILPVLSNHKVDFILVEGVAAVIQGAPIMTFDVDVLYGTAPVNLTRLLAAILETVIAVKEETAGEKDRAMLPILRRTLEESRRI